jgi:hypothetical protein
MGYSRRFGLADASHPAEGNDMSATLDAPDEVSSKLPFWQTVSLSYSFYFRHLGDALRISWLWLLIFVPLTGATNWLQMSWFAETIATMAPGKPPLPPAIPIAVTILGSASELVLFLAGCSIAVAWHRLLLLDEHHGLSGGNVFSRNVWRYVGMGFAILLMGGLPAFAVTASVSLWALPHAVDGTAPAMSAARSNPAIFILIPIAYLAACIIVTRLCLLLPARAVGDTRLTFKEMWSLTRGNAGRIFWGIVACSLPPLLLAQIALPLGLPNPATLVNAGAVPAPWVIFSAIFSGYYLLTLPIFVGFLSHAFLFFRRADIRAN